MGKADSTLTKLMQYDLFDAVFKPLARTIIDIATPGELPNVLAQHAHGVQLGQQFVSYELLRSKRRSIGFLITDQGLRITAPRWVGLAEINAAIISKQRWVLTKLQEQQARPAASADIPTVWQTGSSFPYLGQDVTLKVEFGAPTRFDSEQALLILNLPADASPTLCKKHLQAWLMNQARRIFSQRLPFYAEQLGVHYHSFSLTSASTRWGSCNSLGKIRLNWRLIHFAPQLIDYVIAHELAHLIEMNHSAQFWATVERVFPDYVAARNQLKQSAMKALPQF